MLHANFNVIKALVVAISEYCEISLTALVYRRLHAAAAVRQSANYGSVCRGEERSEYLQESWHRRPAPRSRDQCQKHDLGVTALSFSSAVSRTQAAARNI